MVEKHTEIGISNPAKMHLLLHFEGLVANLLPGYVSIMAVSGKVWKQTCLIMVSLNGCKLV